MIDDRLSFRSYFDGTWHTAFKNAMGWYINWNPETCDPDAGMQMGVVKVWQCTGLKDKNGELIWEGSIVEEICYGVSCKTQVIWGEHTEYGEIDPSATHIVGWLMKDPDGVIAPFAYSAIGHESMSVIGNTTENPDLLEVKS